MKTEIYMSAFRATLLNATLALLGLGIMVPANILRAQNCQGAIDVMLVMDYSGSINSPSWSQEVTFAQNLVSNFTVSATAAHFGVLHFSDAAHLDLPLSSNAGTINSVLANIGNLPSGGTATAAALTAAQTEITTDGRGNPVKHIIILITDGNPDNIQTAISAAQADQAAGTTIYCVGVGSQITLANLDAMASSSSDVFTASDFSSLSAILIPLETDVCPSTGVTTLPNLQPFQPPGWSDKLVIATSTNTETDSAIITTADHVFVSYGVTNAGNASTTNGFECRVYVDGVFTLYTDFGSFAAGDWGWIDPFDIGALSAGSHTFQLVVDYFNVIPESNESENTYSKTINVVSQLPNLTPYQPSGWTDKVVVSTNGGTVDTQPLFATEPLYVMWAMINNGAAATASPFSSVLYVDNVSNCVWTTGSGMAVNNVQSPTNSRAIGTLSPGQHQLKIVLDSTGVIPELNENDNINTKTINVIGPPLVSFNGPINTTNWTCHRFYLDATAIAQGGVITNLEFFLGSTSGTLLAAQQPNAATVSASIPWTTTTPGPNTFVVRATDNYGQQTVSAPVSITTTLPPLNLLEIGITNTECALCLSNVAGHIYGVLATTNPAGIWYNIDNMIGSNGYSYYLDSAFTNLPYRFYRAAPQTDLGFYSPATSFSTNFTSGTPNIFTLGIANGSCSGSSTKTGPFYVAFGLADNTNFTGSMLLTNIYVPGGCPANATITNRWPVTIHASAGLYYLGWVIDYYGQIPNCDASARLIWYTKIKVQ